MADAKPEAKKTTVPMIRGMKGARRIAMLTAYDAPTARIVDEAGIDIILVGDSLAMVVLGHPDTLSVTMEEMLHHARAVARGARRALIVGDMPYLSYHVSLEESVRNAGAFVRAGAHAVKVEGGKASRIRTIEAILDAEIPVMGHVGLTPQSVNVLGGFKLQGKAADDAKRVIDEAVALAETGCFALVLECVPAELAAFITERIAIPTIGIGAGPACDGQVLVLHDLLGLYQEHTPKFVRRYADLAAVMSDAIGRYAGDVREGGFPDVTRESFHVASDEELQRLYAGAAESAALKGEAEKE
ncbi:MAG TPA: 3-methyl-2-oxobutanoate hydroxymethyltransferase [Thermoanaerobaculia bacterium]|nr:3-methyl-2-oxobutanoate hydroxymethyltransferase [Thermoanaerobaculia bacterium]